MDSRRSFLKIAMLTSAGFLGLDRHLQSAEVGRRVDLYGKLVPDPEGILDLPPGFAYRVIARTGDAMDDGLRRPGAPDGMAAFNAADGRVVLVCNHELSNRANSAGPFGKKLEGLARVDRGRVYDFREDESLHMGGTTTLVYHPASGKLERQFLSLVGTDRNCAGGPTPWGTWVTCEEPGDLVDRPEARAHGYAFEVPADPDGGLADPVPLKAMGRFRHEAVAVDPASGVVYETEDRGDGCLYRLIPEVPGDLAKGGRLQALVLAGGGHDTRNWAADGASPFPKNTPVPVRWADVEDTESPKDDMRLVMQREHGAAVFARGEGMWYGEGEVYFACTNGGARQHGQIFRYRPSAAEGTAGEDQAPGTLELFLESDDSNLLEMCDNLTVAPWGDLVVCEDGPGENFVRGVAQDGTVYNLARNATGSSEFCGACFAPDHPVLFVNIQNPGITLAVTGPWAGRRVSA